MKKFYLFPLFILLVLSSFSQIKLDSGLVAYYPFNGNANDESGNGNNPIFNNATLTNDEQGNPNNAYHFNGINNYIEIPNSTSINPVNQISLCALIRPTGFYKGPCHGNSIIMKGDADYLQGNYALRFDDNAYTYGQNCSTNIVDTIHQNFYSMSAQTPSPGYMPYINKDQWYCIVYTYNGSLGKFYLDGNLIDSEYSSITGFSNNYNLFFGRLSNSTFPYWLNADLDEVRIYNRAINSQEVTALCPSASPLPVTLTSFETNISNKQIKLSWHVENESGIVNYTIERSTSTRSDFKEVGIVNADKLSSYTYIDKTALINQTYYYRLKILENTNAISYSEINTAYLFDNNKIVLVYPNPSKGNLSIQIKGYSGIAKLSLINSTGQTVFLKDEIISNNNLLPVTFHNLSGVYWLKITTGSNTYTQKVIFLMR